MHVCMKTHIYTYKHTHTHNPNCNPWTSGIYITRTIYVHDKRNQHKAFPFFSPCSLLVVGWLQHLLTPNTQKTLKIQYLTVKHTVSWTRILLSSAFCQGYNIADCHVFSSRLHYTTTVNSVVSPRHHLPTRGLSEPSRSQGNKMFSRKTPEAPHCFKPYMRSHRSVVVPVPSQLTT